MTKFTIKSAAILFAIVATAASGQAATWIVATNGNDAGSGTLASPFRTITKAASVARAGDYVQVRGGVYHEIVKISSKGTASAPIVFQSYPGEQAVIDGAGSAAGTNLVQISGAEYVDFTDFEVRNSTRIGICGWGGRHVRLLRNTIHSSVKGGIWFGHSSMGLTSDILIKGNTVRNNVLENQFHTSATGWSQAIGLQHTERATVFGNKVFQNDGEGIAFILSDGGRALRNRVFDNYAVNIYLDNARFTTVDSNIAYSTGNTRYYRNSYPAHGIGLANEAYSTSNPLSDLTIINNIVLNSRWGIYYGNYENGGGIKNTLIANNTVYSASHALLNIDSSAHSNSLVQNNIFFQNGGGYGAVVSGGGVTYRNNAWYGATAGAAAGSGDFIGDPRLAKAGGLTADDYRLTSLSPVLQQGVSTGAVTTDYFGTARATAFDIGAHQLSGTVATTTDVLAPTTPANLRVTGVSSTGISIQWDASSDDVGVHGYTVVRDGVALGTVSLRSWSDGNLTPGQSYTYQVTAVDAAGNVSALSASVTGTTTQLAAQSLHVASIAIDYSKKGKNHYYRPRVTVTDQNGKIVPGVVATGQWSGALSGSVSATTQTNGVATFSQSRTANGGQVTFTIMNLEKQGYTFAVTERKSKSTTQASVQ